MVKVPDSRTLYATAWRARIRQALMRKVGFLRTHWRDTEGDGKDIAMEYQVAYDLMLSI